MRIHWKLCVGSWIDEKRIQDICNSLHPIVKVPIFHARVVNAFRRKDSTLFKNEIYTDVVDGTFAGREDG